ncbi:MAG TPA: FAD-dependent oxidoreductase [Acidimicrobiales bacterium]|nr:FAD-dependent oxidoreductase [Acidimicrobiales bacterium]
MRRQGFLRTTAAGHQSPDEAVLPPAGSSDPVVDWRYPGRLSPHEIDEAAVAGGWSPKSRYARRAEVEWVRPLTPTGTVHLGLRVVDDDPFEHAPGQFVGVELGVEGLGYARSPYCILSAPRDDRRFELVVRIVRNGPVSRYLGSCQPGEVIAFRGPTGRSMVPKDDDRDLVLMATGVGVGPLHSLAVHLLRAGFERSITLYWGLRLADDSFLTDDLDALAQRHPNFSYRITLSQPPHDWRGLRGRITESVPPLLPALGGTRFYLCGNGAMTEEMATALSDMGAAEEYIYQEHYFNQKHVPDPSVLAAIRARFVAADLFSPLAHQQAHAALFHLDSPLGGARGNADPTAPSEVGRRMPRVVERASHRVAGDRGS